MTQHLDDRRGLPAASKLEAVTRLSSLSRSAPETLGPGSKERKSVLLNLAAHLGLIIDRSADKPEVGRQIANALSVRWDDSCWSAGQTITLRGLNQLLEGAEQEHHRRRASTIRVAGHVDARSKLEAVTRISSLTDGPPQTLGPGSKERKSVLTDLVSGLGLSADTKLSKPNLSRTIVETLGGSWDAGCWSAGDTITLEGLNRVLAVATGELERRGERRLGTTFASPRNEADALLAILATAVPEQMDGRECVLQMLEAEATHWAQDEWRGWYFEFVGLPALVNAFGGGPAIVANTSFDYSLNEIWDLKCHGDDSSAAILNSREAMDACLADRGIGLLVLSGTTLVDEGDFRQWQRELRLANGKTPRPRTRPTTATRRSKRGFLPRRLDAFFVEDQAMVQSLLADKSMGVMKQGRQVDGSARGDKYTLNVKKAVGGPAHLSMLSLSSELTLL